MSTSSAAVPHSEPAHTTTVTSSPHSAPVDAGSFSPASTSVSVYSPSPTLPTGGLGEGSPPTRLAVAQWAVKASRSADGHVASKRRPTDTMVRSASAGTASGLGIAGFPPRLRPSHSRHMSSPHHSGSSSPDHLRRRSESPSLVKKGPAVIRVALPGAALSKEGKGGYVATDSAAPLDLGIELASVTSTYQETETDVRDALETQAVPTPLEAVTAAGDVPLPADIPSPARPEDEPGTPYAAQVRVSVAQRVERAPSPRKGSLAELSMKRASTATTGWTAPSHAARERSSGSHVPRPVERIAPPSYDLSSVSPQSSHPSGHATDGMSVSSASSLTPASVGNGPGGQAITPGAKLALNLVSLSRRTAHVSDAPGYAWRLNLLEKLEVIMGSFLTIEEAEAVLAIGGSSAAQPKERTTRSNSRASSADSPTPSSEGAKETREAARDRSSFFGRVKRALPGLAKEAVAPPSASRKVVFGAPLAQVAKYGFVTSMIAGQRHELPGVVFSTVEEIYRRGQGDKVPGMLRQHGEPSRVAKLVQIYDSASENYGEHHDLSIESIHNVTSLLKRYLRELPEPVLDSRLWRLLLACVDSKKLPIKARVAAVQIILRLQPAANFSLLTYVLAFLSQVPLFPENSLSISDISTLFGADLLSSRLSARGKKSTSGQLSITGPTEPLESGVEAASRAKDALRFLLEHWTAIADGLLEPDFDVDPAKVVDGLTPSCAPTLDVRLPGAELHIRQAAVASPSASPQPLLTDPLLELPTLAPPREAPAPPAAALPWSALRIKKISPVLEQAAAENSPAPQAASGSTSRCSDPPTPLLVLDESSPSSPQVGAEARTPRVLQEERREEPQQEQASHHSPAASTSDGPGTSSTRSSLSTGSDQGSELRTPPSSTYTGTGVLEKMLAGKVDSSEQDNHALVMLRRGSEVSDGLLTGDDLPLDALSSPSVAGPPASVRLSAFLPPSPFLSQDEVAALLAAEREREIAHLPAPVDSATWAHLTSVIEDEPASQLDDASSKDDKALVPLPAKEASPSPTAPAAAAAVVPDEEAEDKPPPVPLKAGPYASRSLVALDGTFAPIISTTPRPLPAPATPSALSRSPSARASAPAGLNLADLASTSGLPLPLASPTTPRSLPPRQHEPSFLQHTGPQPQLHHLWAQLSALEVERAAERAEMADLRHEVESFKLRMAARLERRTAELDAAERARLVAEVEGRARVELEKKDAELQRAREDLELVRLDAAHAKEEAHRAEDEVQRLRAELEKVDGDRLRERDEARTQIEALEAQLGTIRAVLLGKAAAGQ